MSEFKKNEEAKKDDSFFFITVIQCVLCVFFGVILFFMSKGSGETAQNLKADFENLMAYNIEDQNSNILGQISAYIKAPGSFLPAFAPSGEETTASDFDETESVEVTEETTESSREETSESSTEETTEEKATEETEALTENMGGEDITVYSAAENTSFAPVETTCAIVAPVNSNKYTSAFGYRINPITGEKSFHTGLDIAAPQGSKIVSVYNGTVRKVGEDSRSGKYIFVTHSDGFETFYCHCSKILAEEGAVIRQGETIALVGSTGWSTGPHLHFEVRKEGIRLNPQWILEENDS